LVTINVTYFYPSMHHKCTVNIVVRERFALLLCQGRRMDNRKESFLVMLKTSGYDSVMLSHGYVKKHKVLF